MDSVDLPPPSSRGEVLLMKLGISPFIRTDKEGVCEKISGLGEEDYEEFSPLRGRFLNDCTAWKEVISGVTKIQDLLIDDVNSFKHAADEIVNITEIADETVNIAEIGDEIEKIDVENISEFEKDESSSSARCLPFILNKDTIKVKAKELGTVLTGNGQHKRKNCCPYCHKVITNFMRHLTVKHSEEIKVKQYLSINDDNLKDRKQKRQNLANQLRCEGNYKHNVDVINGCKENELLPVKRPKKNSYKVSNITHISCKYCLGFFKKDSFYVHLHNCNNFENCSRESNRTTVRRSAELLVPSKTEVNLYIREHVFPTMLKDDISVIAQSDPLIVKFANRFYLNHKGKHQVKYISCKMRDLARVFINIKALNPNVRNMGDCLVPSNFDNLIKAIKTMCGYDERTGMCKVPSITSRIRSSLVACVDIIRIEAMKHPSVSENEKKEIYSIVDDFMYLLNREWAVQISASAEMSRRIYKVSKVDILPDSEDIKTFCTYLDEQCSNCIKFLNNHPTITTYEILTKVIIAYIITLNRRRPGEVVNATLKCYRTVNESEDFGILEGTILTKEDILTCKNLSIFYIPSNKNRKKVPIILTEKLKEAVDTLISSREKLKITSDLLFPQPHSNSTYDGTEIIFELKRKIKLKKPDHFTATGLRHHAATSTQLHNKDENYTKSLAKFLGHTLETHKGYYEMPLPIIQKVLVGKNLVEMTRVDNGEINEPANLFTEEMELTRIDNDEMNEPEFVFTGETHSSAEKNDTVKSNIRKNDFVSDYEQPSNYDSYSDSDSNIVYSPVKKSKKIRWSVEEKKIIYKRFGRNFVFDQPPKRKEIKVVWEEEPVLKKNRTLQQVCSYVNNIVTKKVKILTPDKNRIKKRYH